MASNSTSKARTLVVNAGASRCLPSALPNGIGRLYTRPRAAVIVVGRTGLRQRIGRRALAAAPGRSHLVEEVASMGGALWPKVKAVLALAGVALVCGAAAGDGCEVTHPTCDSTGTCQQPFC